MTSPHCPEKATQISGIVGAPTLVTNRLRAGESWSSRNFSNGLVALGSLSPLIFLVLPVISGIDFPRPLHLADF